MLQFLAWANAWKDSGSKERANFIVAVMVEVAVIIFRVGVKVAVVEEISYTLCLSSHAPLNSRGLSHCLDQRCPNQSSLRAIIVSHENALSRHMNFDDSRLLEENVARDIDSSPNPWYNPLTRRARNCSPPSERCVLEFSRTSLSQRW